MSSCQQVTDGALVAGIDCIPLCHISLLAIFSCNFAYVLIIFLPTGSQSKHGIQTQHNSLIPRAIPL